MGGALKKNQDYTDMSRTRFAAWGVVDIELLERMQRRNYINHVRQELKQHGIELECGGSTKAPYYRTFIQNDGKTIWSSTSAQLKTLAFSKVCKDALLHIDPDGFAREAGGV